MSDETTTVTDDTTVVTEAAEEVTTTDTDAQLDDAIENMTLDDLMSYSAENDELFVDDAQHKGMKPLHSWMQHVPEDVRKHLANIRADYTRKTQELSTMRKEVEAAQAAMRQQNEGIMNGEMARQLQDIDTTTEYDLFDSDGMKAEIQRQAKLMLAEMMKPAQQEIATKQRQMQLDQFKSDNPEITDPEYRGPIIEMLKERPELKLEDAFYIVKAKVGATKLQREREELNARKARQREVVRKSSGGTRSAPGGTPKFKSAVEAFEWHKAQAAKR